MTDAEFLRKLADDFGVAAAWGEHAATCKRLREIAARLETTERPRPAPSTHESWTRRFDAWLNGRGE